MTTPEYHHASTVSRNKKSRHVLPIVYPIFLALIFLVLCYPNLTAPPRNSEAYATYLTHGQISDVWDVTTSSGQFPLPYLVLKIWSDFFGGGLVSTRFLNITLVFVLALFTYHVINRRLGFKAALIIPLIITAALSVVKITTRPPESTIKNSLQPVAQLSSQNEPIFIADPISFYSAALYTTKNHPIYFYGPTSSENTAGDTPPAISKINYQSSKDYTAYEKFWLILDAETPGITSDLDADVNQTPGESTAQTPPILPGYRLVNLIENPYHSALEYEKE